MPKKDNKNQKVADKLSTTELNYLQKCRDDLLLVLPHMKNKLWIKFFRVQLQGLNKLLKGK
jgi:hypothetical protein